MNNNQKIPGALELLLELLDLQSGLDAQAPLMQTFREVGRNVITRNEATLAVRQPASCAGRYPTNYAPHSGRIGGASHPVAQRVSPLRIQKQGRWKSQVRRVYVGPVEEETQFI